MANSPDVDADDDFSELYKEYTGPPRLTTAASQEKKNTNKRSHAGSDEEDEPRDPNAVPTDFTSREAKVWEAKSKATERNWKKRKEEEMICKICGESGHFTQGCPSTLGSNRKSQDFFERVPARDKHVRAIFTDRVVQKIEKDVGCKIKMDEKFIIVSGKDRLILIKGVDAVHKVIKEEGDQKGSSSSHMSRSRSPDRSPVGSRSQRSDVHRSHSGPTNTSQFQPRFSRQEKVVENRARDDLQKYSRSSVQGRKSIGYVFGINRKLLMATTELEVVQATQSLQLIRLILATRSVHMIVFRVRVHMVEPKDGIMREEDLICNLVVSLSIQLFPSLLKNWRWSIKGKLLNLERFVIKKKMKKIINTVSSPDLFLSFVVRSLMDSSLKMAEMPSFY